MRGVLLALSLLLMLVAVEVASPVDGELDEARQCVLVLCRLWQTRRVHFFNTSDSLYSDILPYLIQHGMRITEYNNSTREFSNVMAYAFTTFLVYHPDNYSMDLVVEKLSNDSTSRLVTWLLILRPTSTSEVPTSVVRRFLSHGDVPYDSRVWILVETKPLALFEVYRVSPGHELTIKLVPHCAMQVTKPQRLANLKMPTSSKISINTRRSPNLQGLTLTAVVGLSSINDKLDEWTQAYVELWQFLAISLNFTLRVRKLESRLPEAAWSSLLEEVQKGSAQVSLAPILMLPSTVINISFTTPIHKTSFSVLLRSSASERVRWNSYLQPFDLSLWVAVLTSVLLLSLMLAVLWRAEHESSLRLFEYFSEAVLCVLGAACMQGHASPPHSTSARCVHLTALVSAVVVVAVYSSSVTAFLAVSREDRPFSSLAQLLANSRFRPVTLTGSPEHAVFQESLHPALVHHRASAPPSSLSSLTTALAVTCGRNSSLLGPWSSRLPAFVLSSLWADRALAAAPCKLNHFPLADAASQHMWSAFPIKQDLPYAPIINHKLQRMHEAGTILRWGEQIAVLAQLDLEAREVRAAGVKDPRFTVSFRDIAPLLGLLACGAALALVLLALEKLVKYCVTSEVVSPHSVPTPYYSFRL